jgi:hypothetical protein
MSKLLADLTGQRFGRWLVVGKAERNNKGDVQYNCRCDCGTVRIIRRTSLTSGNSKSCGCLSRDVAAQRETTHGDTGCRLYRIWAGIIQRCFNNRERYEWEKYGGRGITVCDEWRKYEPFKEWAIANGYRDDLSIDRIDPNGNYCPENCRWATTYEQSNNKRTSKIIEFNGETGTVREFADKYGLTYSCLYTRLRNGWSVEKAILTSAQKANRTMTNAQKIRAMTDEELAEDYCKTLLKAMEVLGIENTGSLEDAVRVRLEWLQQPAEGD